ncbi:MAG: RNA methyltransferase [Chloroflexota bacterium]|nr:RNA methyltransferase [Chloroflexota bacterium]
MTVEPITDRRQHAKDQPIKTSRWPRTPRRQARVRSVIERRQPDLTVVLEDVHDPHNVSAVLRSCDAVGIMTIHLVYAIEAAPDGVFARTTSASAAKWVAARHHESIGECYAALRAEGFSILATTLTGQSRDLYEQDLVSPVALVFGNEMRGLSKGAIDEADGQIAIPMMGMVQSLNISVACAVILYEAFRQRRIAGRYDRSQFSDQDRNALEEEWIKR